MKESAQINQSIQLEFYMPRPRVHLKKSKVYYRLIQFHGPSFYLSLEVVGLPLGRSVHWSIRMVKVS